MASNEISNIHWHLLDLCVVELLDVTQVADISLRQEVDRDALTAKSTAAPDSVNIILAVCGEVVVDNERDLLDIDTAGQRSVVIRTRLDPERNSRMIMSRS